jgi:hypothetical protein
MKQEADSSRRYRRFSTKHRGIPKERGDLPVETPIIEVNLLNLGNRTSRRISCWKVQGLSPNREPVFSAQLLST